MSVEMPEAEGLKKAPDVSLDSPVPRGPGKNNLLNQQTFNMTISPKGDVNPECEKTLIKWLSRSSTHMFCVAERGKNGQRHLHMCLAYDAPRSKQQLQEEAWRRVKKYHGDSIGKIACVVTTMYSHKWYDEYLRKGGQVILDNYERGGVEQYFPSDEQQRRLCEIKGAPEIRMHIIDTMLAEWVDKDPMDSSYESAIRFLKHRMHVEKKTPYFVDLRKMRETCWYLYEHRNQIIEPNVGDRNFAARETGNSVMEFSRF